MPQVYVCIIFPATFFLGLVSPCVSGNVRTIDFILGTSTGRIYTRSRHLGQELGLRTVHNHPYTVRSTSLMASGRTITAVLVVAGYITITSMNTTFNV